MKTGHEPTEEENPFVSRILNETCVCGNDEFRVVSDIDPIVPGHLLFFTVKRMASLADSNVEATARFMRKVVSKKLGQSYAVIEHGRAPVCTSFGVIHAHAHLIPMKEFNDVQTKLISGFEAIQHSSNIGMAWRSIPVKATYLCWGKLDGPMHYVCEPPSLGKRYIRRLFADRPNSNLAAERR